MGVTVPEPLLQMYAVFPFGVIARAEGVVPTVMALPAVLVEVVIGVTVPEPLLHIYAELPFGVIAIALGLVPMLTFESAPRAPPEIVTAAEIPAALNVELFVIAAAR